MTTRKRTFGSFNAAILLLILLLVVSQFSCSHTIMFVDGSQNIIINVDKTGKYSIDGQVMDEDEVDDYLRRAIANNPIQVVVVIQGDKDTKAGDAIVIAEICTEAGVKYTMSVK